MKAITIALLIWTGMAAAQERNAAFDLPDTTHITLNRTGGVISAAAVNPEDPASAESVQSQLARIAMTGLPELQQLGPGVKYNFEATWDGARIRIRAADAAVLNAVHVLLRLKIAELQTGDSGQVE